MPIVDARDKTNAAAEVLHFDTILSLPQEQPRHAFICMKMLSSTHSPLQRDVIGRARCFLVYNRHGYC